MGKEKSKNIIWRILGYIGLGVLGLLLLFYLIIFIQSKVNPDKVPSIFGYKPFVVLSGSMEQELYKGDLVVAQSVDVNTLKEGDIIAFRDEEGYVITHRIVEIVEKDGGGYGFITKGDNNNRQDSGIVELEKVEGKYLFKMAGFGNVILTMQEPMTLVIILVIIVGAGILWIVLGNNKLSREEKAELEKLRRESKEKKEVK